MVFINDRMKIAYPMVCFCDIPLSQISNHSDNYGHYAIGLKKEWAINKGITPILYTHSNSILCDNIRDNLRNINRINRYQSVSEVTRFNDRMDLIYDLLYTSLFMKPYKGQQKIQNELKDIIFYNEREWRYIPPKTKLMENVSKHKFGFCITERDYTEPLIAEMNSMNEAHGLEFSPNDINYIIVEKEEEILELIDAIQRIKGKYPYDDVKLLSTRIISMERISEDF